MLLLSCLFQFPVDPAMLTRSQQHTLLIHKMLSDFPQSFYPLAIVLKSFMAQNLLNSGESGAQPAVWAAVVPCSCPPVRSSPMFIFF